MTVLDAARPAIRELTQPSAGCVTAPVRPQRRPPDGLIRSAPCGAPHTNPGCLSGRAAQITLPPLAVCSTSHTPPDSLVISRTGAAPGRPSGRDRSQGARPVGMLVLHRHPHPLGADGDLHGERRRQQRRMPYRVGGQFGHDQQQRLHRVVRRGHSLTGEQISNGVPRLWHRGVHRGCGEPPHPLVRQRSRCCATVRRDSPAFRRGPDPRPRFSIVRSPPLRSIVTTRRVLGMRWSVPND